MTPLPAGLNRAPSSPSDNHIALGLAMFTIRDRTRNQLLRRHREQRRCVFGIERVFNLVRENRERPAREIVQALCRAVHEFLQDAPQSDDVTVVVKVQDRG
jgi:hypothetical protein